MTTNTLPLRSKQITETRSRIKPLRMRAYCPDCGHSGQFERTEVDHEAYLRGSLASCGLGLFPWALQSLEQILRPWHCSECGGHEPEFRPVFRLGEVDA